MFNSCSTVVSRVLVLLSPLLGFGTQTIADQRPNILFVTVDDMNSDSVGAFGCRLPNTTPAIDAFAESSLKFLHAHVQVGNCMPSRNVMFSGLFPHTNRVEGFYQIKDPDYPVLCQLMQQAGYYSAIRGKATHSTPYYPFPWDAELIAEDGSKFAPKDVASYYTSTKAGIAASRKANKPFFLSINISDPHKPFWGQGAETDRPSRVFTAAEVPIPGYLVDTPAVRDELALYYSTVRRADDCFGNVMRALNESGLQDQTIVIFLSDHGMPLPFAKTQLYHHSTHTPLLIRWPGVTMPGSTNSSEMISCIDVLPTLLDVIGEESPDHLQGRSFLPLLHGHSQPQREFVFKEYNQNSGGACHPIRAVQSKRYLYLWNPWSDGQRIFRSATQATVTYKQMQQLAKTDPAVAARLALLDHRVPEEFYEIAADPDALNNLIDSPQHQQVIEEFRAALQSWMQSTEDHALDAYRQRSDAQAVSDYVDRMQQKSDKRRSLKRNGRPGRPVAKADNLISLKLPQSAVAGQPLRVTVTYQLPKALDAQQLHVTLKDAANKRVSRQIVSVTGSGSASLKFDVPNIAAKNVSVAAFVGADYSANLQHVTQRIPLADP